MKVLIAHNRYRSDQPSGENMVVDAEIAALSDAGIDVVPFIRSSDEIASMGALDKLDVAMGPIRSRSGVKQFKRLLAEHRPDIVHVHNVFPLLSPWIIREAKAHGIPVVMTVHNFRLDCVAGTYLRDGKICTECSGRSFASPALIHGCYRGSRGQSLPMALARSVHRSTWNQVDRFLALTPFHVQYLRSLGIEDDRILVRPTSAPDPGPVSEPGRDVLFVGRLGAEKGVRLLLDAWAQSTAADQGRRLYVAGDGDERGAVLEAAGKDASILVHGQVDASAVDALMRACGAVVIPSICFEGLPRVLVESFAHGRPAIVSDAGGIGGVIDDSSGWRFERGSVPALTEVLSSLSDAEIRVKGDSARERFLAEFREDVTTAQLKVVYEALLPRSPDAMTSGGRVDT